MPRKSSVEGKTAGEQKNEVLKNIIESQIFGYIFGDEEEAEIEFEKLSLKKILELIDELEDIKKSFSIFIKILERDLKNKISDNENENGNGKIRIKL